MSFYLKDYTTGEELAAGDNFDLLKSLLEETAKTRPFNLLGITNSTVQPGPVVGIAQAQFSQLYALKVAQQQWKETLLPFVETLRKNGLLGAVSDAELQVFHSETLGLDLEAAGKEAIAHARLLRNELNGPRANAGRALVQKGTPEELMSEEQLAVWQEDAETPQYRPLPGGEAAPAEGATVGNDEVPLIAGRPGGLAQAAQLLHADEGLAAKHPLGGYGQDKDGRKLGPPQPDLLKNLGLQAPAETDPHADLLAAGTKMAEAAAERGEAGYLSTDSTRPGDRI